MAAAVAGLLVMIFLAARGRDLPIETDRIRVVTSSPSPGEGAPVRPSATADSGAAASGEEDVGRLLQGAFPALRDVVERCDGARCEITAVTLVPSSGEAQQAYENMVRDGLEAVLRSKGYRVPDGVQIEEMGGDDVRLRLRATR